MYPVKLRLVAGYDCSTRKYGLKAKIQSKTRIIRKPALNVIKIMSHCRKMAEHNGPMVVRQLSTRTSKEKTMFIKILTVSALSICLATSALAQQSGSNGSGSGSSAGTGSSTNSGSGSGSGNGTGATGSSGTNNGAGSNNGGTSSSGTNSDGGKASDCNGAATSKNTTAMKQDQAANPAASSNCQ